MAATRSATRSINGPSGVGGCFMASPSIVGLRFPGRTGQGTRGAPSVSCPRYGSQEPLARGANPCLMLDVGPVEGIGAAEA
jgi:hypothetical protein